MKASRVTKPERRVRSRPCPGCDQPFHPPGADGAGWDHLSAAERRELAELFAAVSTPACVRCGRSGFEASRMMDEQLKRSLQLLRKLHVRTWPALAEFCDEFAGEESSTLKRHAVP
jgi:hypothetical protein